MRVPAATYRLQFRREFGFAAAREVLGYLSRLGVSDVYASPIFQARAGSSHGYDVTDPNAFSEELGGEAGFAALTKERRRLGLGWVQDIVPNHMAFRSENRWLMDVLEKGRASRWAGYFDIDWEHPTGWLRGKVLAPFLGGEVEEVLAEEELRLVLDEEGLGVGYYGWRFPVRLGSYEAVLSRAAAQASREAAGELGLLGKEFAAVAQAVEGGWHHSGGPQAQEAAWQAKELLWRLYQDQTVVREAVEAALAYYNGGSGQGEGWGALAGLLAEQHYALAYWRRAGAMVNYRRFFTINDMIGLRQEEEEVARATHVLVLEAVGRGEFTGLRVDHIDGLQRPGTYLRWLREQVGDCCLVVEKILEGEERLRDWPVEGTSGYEFCNAVNGLFVDVTGEGAFTALYEKFTGRAEDLTELLYEKKRAVLRRQMGGEMERLGRAFVTAAPEMSIGLEPEGVAEALETLVSVWPVYRTYIDAGEHTGADEAVLRRAWEMARRRAPRRERELTALVEVLAADFSGSRPTEQRDRWRQFTLMFQQYTSPAMAKGLEDTLLYDYNRLMSLNEVGGDPGRWGVSVEAFHAFNVERASRWPMGMNTTSTHDTSRSEDVRVRLNVLSEMPQRWREAVWEWSGRFEKCKREVGVRLAPSRNDEYLLYQTVVGAWPGRQEAWKGFEQRVDRYFRKAMREAKMETSWERPNEAYEAAGLAFAASVVEGLRREGPGRLVEDVAEYGMLNSLSQVLLKVTLPGVPDIYQGCELWDLSLVDPDNRRAVDFERRAAMLEELEARVAKDREVYIDEIVRERHDGRIKLFVLREALRVRRELPEVFEQGAYRALAVRGKRAENVVAFVRSGEGRHAIAVAGRLMTRLVRAGEMPVGRKVWGNTIVEAPEALAGVWRDALTGRQVEVGRKMKTGTILSQLPVALLVR